MKRHSLLSSTYVKLIMPKGTWYHVLCTRHIAKPNN